MRILVTNNHLIDTGGTENYTYALAIELKKLGHEVEYFTFFKGMVSDRLEAAGVPFMGSDNYDMVIANHVTTCYYLARHLKHSFIVQTSHGIFHPMEQPSPYADAHVSVSWGVQDHLREQGYQSVIIHNGVDCERFSPTRQVSDKLSVVLSLCQTGKANDFLQRCCDRLGVKLLTMNKHSDNEWSIEDAINQADLVVGIGRSLYDAMACGRPVIVYDNRDYMIAPWGDGYLTKDNIEMSLRKNCCGAGFKILFNEDGIVYEMKKYNPADGQWLMKYVRDNMSIRRSALNYLSLCPEDRSSVGRNASEVGSDYEMAMRQALDQEIFNRCKVYVRDRRISLLTAARRVLFSASFSDFSLRRKAYFLLKNFWYRTFSKRHLIN